MSRKRQTVCFLLCLSLCFFVGCGKPAGNGETETGREAYTGESQYREMESGMKNQGQSAVPAQNPDGELWTKTVSETLETEKIAIPETAERDRKTLQSEVSDIAHSRQEKGEPEASESAAESGGTEVILTREQICEKNRNSFAMPGNDMVDLETFHPQSADEIRAMAEAYPIPDYPYYDGRLRTKEDDAALLASRNLEQIPEPPVLSYGIVTKNAAVRSFPTQKSMTREGKPDDLDYMQESMFGVGEGVVVCHQTADGVYSFVQGYQYRGWIQTDCIGFCTREEMIGFLEADPVAVVTDAVLLIGEEKLRMGTALPLLGETEDGYMVEFPARDAAGNLYRLEKKVPKESVSYGYLDYTKEALLHQAYRMVGQPYGWGDTDGNMDCSSTMNAIFKAFGIFMPRNTSKLALFDAKVTDLSGMSMEEKMACVTRAGAGSMILIPGHVVMYIGEENGQQKILHNVTGYSRNGGEPNRVMECRVTPMEIYSTGGIYYPELFLTLVEVE